MTGHSKAADVVVEIFKLIPPTAGIMLALIWGLANRATLPAHDVLTAIRVASVLLAISILSSFLGLAFAVDTLHADKDVSTSGKIITYFMMAWISFVAGTMAVILSIFLI